MQKKTTVLDFVVRMVMERDPDLAELPKSLNLLSDARTTILSDLLQRAKKIEMSLSRQQQHAKKNYLYDTDDANARFSIQVRKWEEHVMNLSSNRQAAVRSGKILASYFGESSAEACPPERVFGVLHDFARAFERSVNVCRDAKKKEARAGRGGEGGGGRRSVVSSMSSSPMLDMIQRRRAVTGGDSD